MNASMKPLPTPRTLPEFMAIALAMENEAVARYTEFADAMEAHNNREVAEMFRAMAGYEAKHATQIMAEMGWTEAPAVPRDLVRWPGVESPEAAPVDEVHYLMQPWHALQIALAAEQRAEAFFAAMALAVKDDDAMRRAADELRAEEAEHVALVRAWMEKVPHPSANWAEDPDPPRQME